MIGSGPAGQKAAIQAAKLGKRVAVVERRHMVGGVCTNTGTLPSKTLREAVVYLTGMAQKQLYGQSYQVKDEITIDDLFWRTQAVIQREIDVVRNQLARNHVQMLHGDARFVDAHTVAVTAGSEERRITARQHRDRRRARARTGRRRSSSTTPRVLDSDGILKLPHLPRALVVVGGGVIGIEYASMFAALGTKVTVIEQRHRLLDFCDDQITEALQYHLRDIGVTFRFGEEVVAVERHDGRHHHAPEERQADRRRHRALLRRPDRRHRGARARERRAGRRHARPHRGRRALPHGRRRTSTRSAT